MCKSFLHKSPSKTRIDFYSIVYAKRVDKDHTVRKSSKQILQWNNGPLQSKDEPYLIYILGKFWRKQKENLTLQ